MTRKENSSRIIRKEESISISAKIKLGMPSKKCAYSGICKIEPEQLSREIEVSGFSPTQISRAEDEKLLFRFAMDQLKKETIRKHFGSGYFVVIEAYRLPEFLSEAFGLHKPIICQGIYPVKHKNGTLEVQLTIEWEA